ncbi:Phosphoglycerate mutase-like protein AT74H [Abeliophyllum distichum]|uniref:Phosphoglycerate mutase-like protein AT74H n=1 Tax=Abeliophyllum distichum TaxID=126358 RepID=A0ABD1P2W2_9LAMI
MLGNSSENSNNGQTHHHRFLPKRIILLRHGESEGNIDGSAYTTTPDHKIPLTSQGIDQAKKAGWRIRHVVSDAGECSNWKVYFYVSPYERTRSTLREIGRAFPKKRVIGVREECRVREQDFGNFQVAERMKAIKETREKFGRFFYRFPEGESAADVYDRVSRHVQLENNQHELTEYHDAPLGCVMYRKTVVEYMYTESELEDACGSPR